MNIEYRHVAAMLSETETVQSGPQEFLIGKMGESKVVLLQCGIGKTNAASGVTNLIMSFHPDYIISTGAAGGIDAKLNVMDIVIGKEVCYHDVICGDNYDPGQVQGLPRFFSGNAHLIDITTSLQTDIRIVPGLICTGDQFITDKAALTKIKASFPEGLACEMESAAIAHTCYQLRVPFLSIRVISDTPGNTDNHQQQWDEFLASMGERSFLFMQRFLSQLPHKCN